MNERMNKIKVNEQSPVNIMFNLATHSYNILTANKTNISISKNIFPQGDALIRTTRMFENIKFQGLGSLIEFCKRERILSLQMVLEWVNYVIYKDDTIPTVRLGCDPDLIVGVNNFIDKLQNEKEEKVLSNGVNSYTSSTRNIIVKLLIGVMNEVRLSDGEEDFDTLLNKFTFNVFVLNFQEANRLIREIFNLKDNKKIPNEIVPILLIFQEAIQHFEQSNLSSFQNLNSTVKNLMTTFDKIDMSFNFRFTILFIQQKFQTKYKEFLQSKEIPLIIKLIFIFKYDSKEEMLEHLSFLDEHYTQHGLLEGLILSGSTKSSIKLIENYLDSTDDLLLCFILSKLFINSKEHFHRKCENALFDVLNHLKLFNARIQLEQKVNEICSHINRKDQTISRGGKRTLDLILTCFYCNTRINTDKSEIQGMNSKENVEHIDFCPKCVKKFPSCAICLSPIVVEINLSKNKAVQHFSAAELKREKLTLSGENLEEKTVDLKYLWCTKCRHGGHVDHIQEWFQEIMICPVADCACLCLEYNHLMT